MNNRSKTDFLYAAPSFLMGIGGVLNIGGRFHEYNTSENPDQIAIASDWEMIGQDLRDALESLSPEIGPVVK
jgi:hypothetical protein